MHGDTEAVFVDMPLHPDGQALALTDRGGG